MPKPLPDEPTLLLRLVLEDPDPGVRESAAYALCTADPAEIPTMTDELLGVLRNESEAIPVRAQVVETIGSQLELAPGRRRVAPVFVGLLEHPAPELRFWSCYALALTGDEREVPALERLLGDATMVPGWWSVRREARWAIDCLSGVDPVWPEPGEV